MSIKLSSQELLKPTSLFAIGLMVVILMMTLPIPSWVMDIGLTASFAFAILIFTTTIFIEKPLDFSSFPSVLLASLMLRLSLNVSSTKLIIGEGHTGTDAAGGVIEGFAMFIMGGNLFLGLVVFFVLIIVNFMVITKGAGRMAEVGARFALDAMPGKQMAIDSDLAAGAIDHAEAIRRREVEQEEAAFLGSLDGASKFVKGDAIAGLLITALNFVAGIAIGVTAHKISLSEALTNYSILTVGDGLVSQIPAVIVSISAALLLSKGKGEGALDLTLLPQLARKFPSLLIVSLILMVFAFFPGLPFLPFFVAAIGFGVAGFMTLQSQKRIEADKQKEEDAPKVEPKRIGDSIDVDEIHLEVAPDLVATVIQSDEGFEQRIDKIRRYIAEEYGFVLPPIRLTDNAALEKNKYRIKIQGVTFTTNILRPGQVLALVEDNQHTHLSGEKVKEPVYGASARWIPNALKSDLTALGVPVVEPMEVLATHLLEVIQANFGKIFTRQTLRETLDAFTNLTDQDRAAANRKFLDEFIPDKVPIEILQTVLRSLLEERVSIRNLGLIIEAIGEVKGTGASIEQICEFVRRRMAFQIVTRLRDDQGRLPLVQISQDWEKRFMEYEVANDNGSMDVALPPEDFNKLVQSVQGKLNDAASRGIHAALATSARRRKFLRTVLMTKGIKNPVLAYDEITATEKPLVVGVA